jgi:hypothetical protein
MPRKPRKAASWNLEPGTPVEWRGRRYVKIGENPDRNGGGVDLFVPTGIVLAPVDTSRDAWEGRTFDRVPGAFVAHPDDVTRV